MFPLFFCLEMTCANETSCDFSVTIEELKEIDNLQVIVPCDFHTYIIMQLPHL